MNNIGICSECGGRVEFQPMARRAIRCVDCGAISAGSSGRVIPMRPAIGRGAGNDRTQAAPHRFIREKWHIPR